MSTTYYLVDVNKKKEYEKFRKFWEKDLRKSVENQIKKFLKENKGEIICPDMMESLNDNNALSNFVFTPLDSECYESEIGTLSSLNQVFHAEPYFWMGMEQIRPDELEKKIKEHKEWQIEDEYGKKMSFQTFKKIINNKE